MDSQFNPHNIFPKWNIWIYVAGALGLTFGFSAAIESSLLMPSLLLRGIDIVLYIFPLLKLSARLKEDTLQRAAGAWFVLMIVSTANSVITGTLEQKIQDKKKSYYSYYSYSSHEVRSLQETLDDFYIFDLMVLGGAFLAFLFLFFSLYSALKNQCKKHEISINPILFFFGFQYGYSKYIVDQIAEKQPESRNEKDDFGVGGLFLIAFKGGWTILVGLLLMSRLLVFCKGCLD